MEIVIDGCSSVSVINVNELHTDETGKVGGSLSGSAPWTENEGLWKTVSRDVTL